MPNQRKKVSVVNRKVLYLIEQASTLMMMQRNHVRNLGNTTFDTIASHCFHTAVIAYCIARMEKLSHEDGLRALTMGLLHDLVEARTGDNDFVTKNYTTMDEARATDDQFDGFGFGKDLKDEIIEYEKRESKVSKCVKDADHIAQMYMEWSLSWQGNKLAEKWFKGDMIHRVPHLHTKSAKKLVEMLKSSDPQEWWWNQFVDNKGPNLKHLNG